MLDQAVPLLDVSTLSYLDVPPANVTLSGWDLEIPKFEDGDQNRYSLTMNYALHLSWGQMSIEPVNPWDLGINPLVPDSLENWWYGRTPDGTGGAWSNDDNIWSYWDRNGNLVGKYTTTTANDPNLARVVTFTTTSTTTYNVGMFSHKNETTGTTTVYLRSGG